MHWTGIRRRRPEQDLTDFDAGVSLTVAGFTKTIGGEDVRSIGKGRTITRLRSGWLTLTAGEAPAWRDRVGSRTASLHGPFALDGDGERVPAARQFAGYQLTTADGTFDIALPKKDVLLVRHAFAAWSQGAGQGRETNRG